MKIFYESVKEEGLTIERSFSFDDLNDRYDLASFDGRIDKAGDVFIVTGQMQFTFSSICDRCLEAVKVDFNQSIVQAVSPLGSYPKQNSESEELGLSDEEADIYVTAKDYIDIDQFLKEEMFLASPAKRLCSAECKGICNICGALLNKVSCSCDRSPAEEIGSSGLSKLNDLKK